jgi:ABC-type glutathione transport system ATPase component
MTPLLSVSLTVDYPDKFGVVRRVEFAVDRGEVLGLVGQSGSGKSTIALALMGLLGGKGGLACGKAMFDGRNLLVLPEKEMRQIRGQQIGMVMQSPLAALNPWMRLEAQFRDAWRAHAKADRAAEDRRFREVLESVSLPGDKEFLRRYPRELSVGLAQRVLIALAILHRPALLIADEPSSALDAITAAEILDLFGRLCLDLDMAMLYISHDLCSVASLCDRIAILHQGELVEQGETREIFENPQHPYARRLIAALPQLPRNRYAVL